VVWALSTVFGFEQYGLSYVLLGLVLAYSGSIAYAYRRWKDRRDVGLPRVYRLSLHAKLAGAMIAVMALDGAGYLLAVHNVRPGQLALVTILQDIFVAVALLTVSVGLILPGIISHAVTEVGDAARRLAEHTLPELTRAMVALGAGNLHEEYTGKTTYPVTVRTRDEVGVMATHFNAMQERVTVAATALDRTREQLASSHAQLEYLADHDALTGLVNRRRLLAELERTVLESARYAERSALVLIDLDNFKLINDTRGHALGDVVLRHVATALRGRLRATDTLARLGGDEFAVILPRCDLTAATAIARNLIEAVALTPIVAEPAATPCGSMRAQGSHRSAATTRRSARRPSWPRPTSPCTRRRRPAGTGSPWHPAPPVDGRRCTRGSQPSRRFEQRSRATASVWLRNRSSPCRPVPSSGTSF
jgi:diguanylate cyclase (GGDEF)-like protein